MFNHYLTLHNKGVLVEVQSQLYSAIQSSKHRFRWGFLEVETEDVALHLQAYAAGLAEGDTAGNLNYNNRQYQYFLIGQVTRSLIFDHLRNTVEGYCDGAAEYCQRLGLFMLKNYEWMQTQISANPNDVYWQQAGRFRRFPVAILIQIRLG